MSTDFCSRFQWTYVWRQFSVSSMFLLFNMGSAQQFLHAWFIWGCFRCVMCLIIWLWHCLCIHYNRCVWTCVALHQMVNAHDLKSMRMHFLRLSSAINWQSLFGNDMTYFLLRVSCKHSFAIIVVCFSMCPFMDMPQAHLLASLPWQ